MQFKQVAVWILISGRGQICTKSLLHESSQKKKVVTIKLLKNIDQGLGVQVIIKNKLIKQKLIKGKKADEG